ncbi:hypothetical protein AJ80_00376 [Polytolypa hystricis UAMH7299]|uniref:Thioesterase domain-containing protein n=1 Tax=Polytolypa hystricis (strain UAMH7299) TaxID=1447883 RepID=A0A2B7Z1L6_POLH7|nr:hypothetical protein AJ80_00376 [Polytolypa hystricis UAMH7299]
MSSSSSSPSSTSSTTYEIPAAALARFQSNPWTASLLSSPHYHAVKTYSREAKETSEDTYFGATIATPTTIPHCVTLHKRHIDTLAAQPPQIFPPPVSAKPQPTPKTPAHVISLFDFSAPGICGHPLVAHGGVIATVLDEVMSLTVARHIPGYNDNEVEQRGRVFTVQLDVRYLKPVAAPALTVVKTWCVAQQGRKFWMRGQLVQEEEGDGGGQLEWVKRKIVCAEAFGVWILARPAKL